MGFALIYTGMVDMFREYISEAGKSHDLVLDHMIGVMRKPVYFAYA